jgi:hypothetical protein
LALSKIDDISLSHAAKRIGLLSKNLVIEPTSHGKVIQCTSCSTTNALQLVFGNPWQSGVAHVHAEQPHLEKHTSNPSNPSKLSIGFFLILLKLPLTHIP